MTFEKEFVLERDHVDLVSHVRDPEQLVRITPLNLQRAALWGDSLALQGVRPRGRSRQRKHPSVPVALCPRGTVLCHSG